MGSRFTRRRSPKRCKEPDYYSTVSAEQVWEYLEKQVSSGLVAMNGVGTD